MVQGNLIGTDITGTFAIPNGTIPNGQKPGGGTKSTSAAIYIGDSPGNTIGGTTPALERALRQHRTWHADRAANAIGNVVEGNFIGTDSTGTKPVPNTLEGIVLQGNPSSNLIGGTAAGEGNVIAFNGTEGVALLVGDIIFTTGAIINNGILGNSIFSNGGIGIDLGGILTGDGVTPNHARIPPRRLNLDQNYPVLTSASGTNVQGTLHTAPSTTYRIEFFSNAAADPSGFGQGQTFLGFANVTTDPSGNATINATLTTPVAAGQFVSATATDPNNNTSEFSKDVAAAAVPADLGVTLTAAPSPVNQNSNLTYTIVVTNSGPGSAANTTVTDTLPAGVTFVSATGGVTPVNNILTFSLGTLATGTPTRLTIVVQPNSTGMITDTASVSSPTPDPDPSNNSASVTTTVNPIADLGVTISAAPNPVTQNGSLTYTIMVSNSGPSPSSGVVLTDVFPAGVTPMSFSFTTERPGQRLVAGEHADRQPEHPEPRPVPHGDRHRSTDRGRFSHRYGERVEHDDRSRPDEQHRFGDHHGQPGQPQSTGRPRRDHDGRTQPRDPGRPPDLHAQRHERRTLGRHRGSGRRHASGGCDVRLGHGRRDALGQHLDILARQFCRRSIDDADDRRQPTTTGTTPTRHGFGPGDDSTRRTTPRRRPPRSIRQPPPLRRPRGDRQCHCQRIGEEGDLLTTPSTS